MPVEVYPNPEKLSEAAAHFFIKLVQSSIKARGKFTVALSGGSSPRRTYELLASDPFKKQVPWDQVFVFWGDERFVPPDDSENNARMARETLLDHVPIPSDHIFAIPTHKTPEAAAENYALTLTDFFGQALPQFDLILLGLGENGHTSSLFPMTDVLEETTKWVAPVYIENKQQYRITLTVPVFNNARHILFLVYGDAKVKVVNRVIEGSYQPRQLPAQLIKPKSGNLYWFIDKKAAASLRGKNR